MLALLLLASPPAIAEMCEGPWIEAEAPATEDTRSCARHLLSLAYGEGWSEEELELDPPAGTHEALRFTAAQLERMGEHIRRSCGLVCQDVSKQPVLARAAEWAEREAAARSALSDPIALRSIRPLLEDALAGRALGKLDDLSALSLWKLRNAVFARHGRRFEHADLTRFFYGPKPAFPGLAPLEKPTALAANDEANVAKLVKAEKRLRSR